MRAWRGCLVKEKILEVVDLCKEYPVKRGALLPKEIGMVHAVNHVSFTLYQGETLGIIGESGCGKTTLIRMLMGLEEATGGYVQFGDKKIHRHMPPLVRKNMQMVFQDPYASLDPRMSIQRILEEPLRIHERMSAEEKKSRILPLLEQVGLSRDSLKKYPHEFSGGQRQRMGIARALAVNPEFLFCDEPISALDVSIQAQIMNLLMNLQRERNLTMLFIAHDLAMVKHISDNIGVMYLGKLVEISPAAELYENPYHPYTQALLESIPIADPDIAKSRGRHFLTGDVPSPIDPPKGCRFCGRCSKCMDICNEVRPELKEVSKGHQVACHLYD